MSQQTPVHVKLTSNAATPGRPSVVQVVTSRSGGAPVAIVQNRPAGAVAVRSLVSGSTNTAMQYQRASEESGGYSQGQLIQTPLQTQFGSSVLGFGTGGYEFARLPIPNQLNQAGLGAGATMRKPCNCTKSNCLKLYCECFAQGQLCQNCNCNNCMNNLAHEEERRRAVKMTLERNPTAFNPKIGRGEGERKHTKGCNCKRSGCLKNYCECYEAKISCSDLCRCVTCKNTEDSVERRSLQRLTALAPSKSKQAGSFKKHLTEPPEDTLPHAFFTWEVIEAVAFCLLVQGDDVEHRDIPPMAQERSILEEFGRAIERVMKSASKAHVRAGSNTAALMHDAAGSLDDDGMPPPHGPPHHHGGHRDLVRGGSDDEIDEAPEVGEEDEGMLDVPDMEPPVEMMRPARGRPPMRGSGRPSRGAVVAQDTSIGGEEDVEPSSRSRSGSRGLSNMMGGLNVTQPRSSGRRHVPSRRFRDEDAY